MIRVPAMNDKVLEERIRNGIKHFQDIKPSEFNAATFLHLKYFLTLLQKFMDGEKVNIVDLDEKPRYQPGQIEEAKKAFNLWATYSEGSSRSEYKSNKRRKQARVLTN